MHLEERLKQFGQVSDEDLDLAETALTLSLLDRPAADPAPYRASLDALVADARRSFAAQGTACEIMPATTRAMALGGAIAEKHGFEGDRTTYDDLDNADLIRVLERRRGLPVALSILYIHVGRALGWEIHGLNIPGHFVLEITAGSERAILDPFNRGRLLSESDLKALISHILGPGVKVEDAHMARASNRDIILRLENNLAGRALKTGDKGRALTIVGRMLLLAPHHASLWREYGMLQAMQGNVLEARQALETCIEEAHKQGDSLMAEEAVQALSRLRGKFH